MMARIFKKKIQERFIIDEIDKILAMIDPGLILSDRDAKRSFDSFKRVLAKHRYDNEEGYKSLFVRLKNQLAELNIHVKNFEIIDRNVWLLFHVRNIRLMYERTLGKLEKKMGKIVLNYSAKMDALINSKEDTIFVSPKIYDKPVSRLVSFYIAAMLNVGKIKRGIFKLKERPISILGLYNDAAESISSYVLDRWHLHKHCLERYGIIKDSLE